MRPTLSIIFFTTVSGAGYGLLFLIGCSVAAGGTAAGLWAVRAGSGNLRERAIGLQPECWERPHATAVAKSAPGAYASARYGGRKSGAGGRRSRGRARNPVLKFGIPAQLVIDFVLLGVLGVDLGGLDLGAAPGGSWDVN